uniref:NADH-ubiquinone oxidoreductase chain 2 n=1 Tax=Eurypharynx pelecanoides TaxID=55117 RepID=Q76MN6_EURPE|nr:NADH dehydrogenase subunit 2 [Eurypharynx pelecanoides]
MNPYVMFLMFTSLGLGTTITFASSHWLMAWMGLEINTLAIIPLMAQHRHPRAVEATVKYFLVQATAATLMLFMATSNAWLEGQWEIEQLSNLTPLMITTLALGLKMGLAPMHFWLPEVLQGLSLTTGLILLTWQKLAPMVLMYQISSQIHPLLILTLATMSVLVGGWGGLNQTQLRKLLAYSSIAHMGWMMAAMKYMPDLTILALMTYIMMTSSIFLMMKLLSATKINELATAWTKAPTLAAINMVTILSLGGLPPLTGFMPKWFIIQELTKQTLPVTPTLLALATLLSLFFYLRMCYSLSLTSAPNTNNSKTAWRFKPSMMMFPLSTTVIISSMMLPLAPTMLAMAVTTTM